MFKSVFFKKLFSLAAALLVCAGCAAGGQADVQSPSSEAVSSQTEASSSQVPEPDMTIQKPEFRLVAADAVSVTLEFTSSLENVETIVVYQLDTGSDYPDRLARTPKMEFTPEFLDENGRVRVNITGMGESSYGEKINSAIKTDFSTSGIMVFFANEKKFAASDCLPMEVVLGTGNVNQRGASFRGDTACGAANGALLLQTVLPQWGDTLRQRLDQIRSYSEESQDYSTGAELDYCMSSTHIVNSVNRYLEDSGIEGYRLKDFGREDSVVGAVIRDLLETGRPAAVMVAYADDAIIDTYRYGHWITVNGYRLGADGWEYRWENTLFDDYGTRWVTQAELEAGFNAMAEHLSESSLAENPWGIVALEEPLVESMM